MDFHQNSKYRGIIFLSPTDEGFCLTGTIREKCLSGLSCPPTVSGCCSPPLGLHWKGTFLKIPANLFYEHSARYMQRKPWRYCRLPPFLWSSWGSQSLPICPSSWVNSIYRHLAVSSPSKPVLTSFPQILGHLVAFQPQISHKFMKTYEFEVFLGFFKLQSGVTHSSSPHQPGM